MAISHHDIGYEQINENFNSFHKNSTGFTSNINDVWKNTMDYDNIYRIEKEAAVQDQFDNISDMDQDMAARQPSLVLKPTDEIFSQKFNQSSTTMVNDQPSMTMLKDIEDHIKKIPDFLTKRNEPFRQMLRQALSTTTTAAASSNKNDYKNNIEALRHIAILIYKIILIQTYQTLWTTYLKSGMAQLIIQSSQNPSTYPTNLKIWPKEIKTMIQSTISMNKTNDNEEIYMAFVNNNLHQLDHQLKQHKTELKIKATNFNGYTLTIQQMIEAYIVQNLRSFHMHIEHQIQLVHYDYHIRALKIEYLRQNPNEYEVQLMKEICQSSYEQETTEQESNFLKQQIAYYNLPGQSFQCCSSIAHSPFIDSIENPTVRQELFEQLKQIAEQSRAALFNVYLKSSEDQKREYKTKLETNQKKMCSDDHHSMDNTRKIPQIMVQLINQRCQKMNERIKCIYEFKTELFNLNQK